MVVTAPPLMAVVPPAFVVSVVRALVPPTTPPKVVVPVEFTVRVCAPSTVVTKVTGPLPALTVTGPVKVTAEL